MYAVVCTFVIMVVSLAYTFWTLSSVERMQYFNYVMFIPAPIAFVFFAWETKSFKKATRPLRTVPSLRAMTFAGLFPILFLTVLTIIVVVVGLGSFNSEKLLHIIKVFPEGLGLLFALGLLIGEEYAWRGYLQPRYTEMFGPLIATVLVGAIWAIWHGPLVYGLVVKLGTSEDPLLFTGIQMAAVLTLSFPFAYSYYISGSIIPPVVIHFLWNWLNPALLGNVYRNQLGVVEGNLLYINGEMIGGVLFGLLFVIWFTWKVQFHNLFSNWEISVENPV